MIRTYVEDFETDLKFQGVFFLDVLEHIPNPHTVLEKVFELLDSPGVMIAMVPNLRVQQVRVLFARFGLRPFRIVLSPGNHINHFSPRTLGMLFERQPFAKVRVCNSPIDLQYIRGLPRWWAPAKKLYWRLASIGEKSFSVQVAGNITVIGLKS